MPKPMGEMYDVEVKINGSALPPELYAALLDLDVQSDNNGPTACRLSFLAWDDKKQEPSTVEPQIFVMGTTVEVALGPAGGKLVPVCKAEIVALELDLSSGQAPRFSLRAYDRSHRLRRGTFQRSFAKMKYSDIASQIANKNGLEPDVDDSSTKHDYVLQDNKSDLDFLKQLAKEIDHEVRVDDKKLVFKKSKTAPKAIELVADVDLTELSAFLKAMDQVGAVEVRGWDPQEKKPIVGTSGDANAAPPEASGDAAFGKATIVITDEAISKQEDADRRAYAELERRARQSMSVQGGCLGRTDLQPGVEIELKGPGTGKIFFGKYRLTSVTHRYSVSAGFHTSFSAEKQFT